MYILPLHTGPSFAPQLYLFDLIDFPSSPTTCPIPTLLWVSGKGRNKKGMCKGRNRGTAHSPMLTTMTGELLWWYIITGLFYLGQTVLLCGVKDFSQSWELAGLTPWGAVGKSLWSSPSSRCVKWGRWSYLPRRAWRVTCLSVQCFEYIHDVVPLPQHFPVL